MKTVLARVLMSLGLLLAIYRAAEADTPYYQGKTLVVVQGQRPGGLGDLRTRAVLRYLQKYLSGNPTIVSQNRTAGGRTAAANYMANVVKRDGLTLASTGSSMFSNAILGTRGYWHGGVRRANVRYKLDDFEILGSPTSGGPYTLIIRPDLKLDTVEKLRSYKGLRFAQRSVGHSMYMVDRMFAFILELQDPKWILGYSSQEIYTALERKEADGKTNTVFNFLRATPHWRKQGFTTPIVMKNVKGKGAELAPKFPQSASTLDNYVDTDLKRGVMQLYYSTRPASSGFIVPKGIPDSALKDLKMAFNKIWEDPQFAKDYRRQTGEPALPVTGEEIDAELKKIPKDPTFMKVYKQVISAGPLPRGR